MFLKKNMDDTRVRFLKWWEGNGGLIGQWKSGISQVSNDNCVLPGYPEVSLEKRYINAEYRAECNHKFLMDRKFPGDILPVSDTDLGPGSLCLYLGCNPEFQEDTVWYEPLIKDKSDASEIIFNSSNKWWNIQLEIIKECVKASKGQYFVGIPDLVESLDTLASLREAEHLLFDMIESPQWVKDRIEEINEIYFKVYNSIYDLVKVNGVEVVFGAFRLWAPGKVAKVQCDVAAMFSPDMFYEFFIPSLKKQCDFLDYSMFHLDGTQCLDHLKYLLEIESLNAIEWTPQAGIPGGGGRQWYDLYKRILDSGKSVQAVGVKLHEIIPLVKEVGLKGMYILSEFDSLEEFEKISRELVY